jgi:hypothetical protein
MTIAKGRPWGETQPLPDDGVVVHSDAEAAGVVTEARRAGHPVPTIGLLGGDLCRTLGGRGDVARMRSAEAVTFPVDLGTVVADGRPHLFVAHAVARNRWWTRGVVAMNAQWIGAWNAGPRAHPNDGLLDTYEARVAFGDLRQIRRRALTGSHLPHPGIRERRAASPRFTLAPPLRLWVDGVGVPGGAVSELRIDLEPDALRVVV